MNTRTLNPEFVSKVQRLVEHLPSLNYFQMLRVDPNDSNHLDSSALSTAYRRQMRMFHPESYAWTKHERLIQDLTVIAKFLNQAYRVLKDPDLRAAYCETLVSDRDQASFAAGRDAEVQKEPLHPLAAGHLRQFNLYLEKGELESARRSLQMAQAYDKAHPDLWEAERRLAST